MAVKRRPSAAPSGAQEVSIIEPRGGGLLARAREVWRYRYLLGYFARMTIQRRTNKAVWGWFWLIVRPVGPLVVTTILFNKLVQINLTDMPYFLFLVVSMAVWTLFEQSFLWATRSLRLHARLLSKLYFPRIILPPASTSPAMVQFVVYLFLTAVTTLYFVVADGVFYPVLGSDVLWAVVGALLALVFGLGLGLFGAVLGAEHQDFRYTAQYVLQFWFFLTPVAYPFSLVPESWRDWMALNPMVTIAELFRLGLLGMPTPIDGFNIATTLLTIGVVFLLGYGYFSRAEAESVDRL